MGSPNKEDGRSGTEKRHEVKLTKAYFMGKFTVTQGQWKAMMGKTQRSKITSNECVMGGLPGIY